MELMKWIEVTQYAIKETRSVRSAEIFQPLASIDESDAEHRYEAHASPWKENNSARRLFDLCTLEVNWSFPVHLGRSAPCVVCTVIDKYPEHWITCYRLSNDTI